jgi:hypothetical protein
MNPVTTIIGVLAVCYGLYTTWARARVKKAEQFAKLDAMKKRWGEKAGTAIHVIAYTVVPIVFGIVMIIRGLQGGSLF